MFGKRNSKLLDGSGDLARPVQDTVQCFCSVEMFFGYYLQRCIAMEIELAFRMNAGGPTQGEILRSRAAGSGHCWF